MLLRLALTSSVSAGRVAPRSGGAVPKSTPPSGTLGVAERYAQLIAAATSDREARRHLDAARAELQAILRRPLAGATDVTRHELELRVVSEGSGMAAVDVAIMCRCTVSLVRHARICAERDPERGRSLVGVSAERWARELRASGYSLRAVAALTGVPRSTLAGREVRARGPVGPWEPA